MSMDFQPVLARLANGPINTDFGEFQMAVFHDGQLQAITLSLGDISGQENVLCRIHSECISSHVFFSRQCDCRKQMIYAQDIIRREGQGLIVFLEQEGRGHGAAAHVATLELKKKGYPQNVAYGMRGFAGDARRYDMAAKVIAYFQIKSVTLMSSNKLKKEALEKFGIAVREMRGHSNVLMLEEGLKNLEGNIREGNAEPLWKSNPKRIFVVGDLNVDYNLTIPKQKLSVGGIIDKPSPVVGGTAFNAARAFKESGFESIIFGKVGNDHEGRQIISEIERSNIKALLAISEAAATGNCHLIFIENDIPRTIIQEGNNANDYDTDNLAMAIGLTDIGERDIVFVVGHPFVRFDREYAKKLIDIIAEKGAKIILDVIPHNMYEKVSLADFKYIVGDRAHVIIAEFSTLMRFLGRTNTSDKPSLHEIEEVVTQFSSQISSRILIIRYGEGNIEKQTVCRINPERSLLHIIEQELDTGYTRIPLVERRGFGDRLTAKFLSEHYQELNH